MQWELLRTNFLQQENESNKLPEGIIERCQENLTKPKLCVVFLLFNKHELV